MKKLTGKRKNISTIIIVCLIVVGFSCGIATGISKKTRENSNH